MPTYDYECQQCGKRFEIFQSMNAPKLTECQAADCKGELKRLLGSGGGIIFKGSGFYQTDYKSSGASAAAKPADAPKSGGCCGGACQHGAGAKKAAAAATGD